MRCKFKVCNAKTLDHTKCLNCVGPKGVKSCPVCWQHKTQCAMRNKKAVKGGDTAGALGVARPVV